MRKVILEKLSSSTPQDVRDYMGVGKTKYTGLMQFGPSVGKSFAFFRDDGEYMHTSTVRSIQFDGNDITLKTKNSTYRLTVGAEQEPI